MNKSACEHSARASISVSKLMRLCAHRMSAALCGAFAVMLLASGCATTKVDVLWSNPDFASRKIEGSVLVVGLARDQAIRRAYEDELVSQLTARGIRALRSYELLQSAFDANAPRPILEAARHSGVTTILSSAVVGHEHLARGVVFDEPTARWAGMYEGWYQHYWPYVNRRTEVQITERYLASTTLVDVAAGKIRWTARTHTDAMGDLEKDIKGFVSVIVGTLAKGGLL